MSKVTVKKGTSEPQNLIVQQTTITQVVRQQIDIGKWRAALKSAENITNPNRSKLYDIYSEIELDGHLESVMEKRKAAIMKKDVTFIRNGEVDLKVMEQLDSPWFFLFKNDLLDTIFWGCSVFQFWREGEWIKYNLVPRKHIRPELGIMVKNQNDQTGISYRNNPEFPNVLETNFIKPLGLLNKAAPYVIYKRNGLGDFAEFAETYGQPMREGVYDGYDEEVRKKLVADLTAAGRSAVFVHPKGTEVNIIDSAFKASSTGIYDKLIVICNEELSKLGVGNTLTTQQGENGARSLGDVHKEGEETLNITDEQWFSNVLNYDMTDIFASLGVNTQGGKFVVTDKKTVDLSKRIEIDTKVAQQVPVDDDYFYETYNVTKPKNYEQLKKERSASAPMPSNTPKDVLTQNLNRVFYDVYGRQDESVWERVYNFFAPPRRR